MMKTDSPTITQALVFLLVGSAVTTVYITQPVLPVIENEFVIDARTASLFVSMVIFGIALANLPFETSPTDIQSIPLYLRVGWWWPHQSCLRAHPNIVLLIGARFVRGLSFRH
jgi:YNFM family putative membrane transporter